MKDIPVFTTEYGVASLIFKEIPYKQLAFVHMQDVQPGGMEAHLRECVTFCRMAGAERILAKGHEALAAYPLHSIVYRMALALEPREPEANLWPVTEETVSKWREIYNARMAVIDNHATLTSRDEKEIIASGGAYFVHRDGQLLGIGWLRSGQLLALASTVPGTGFPMYRIPAMPPICMPAIACAMGRCLRCAARFHSSSGRDPGNCFPCSDGRV